MICQLRSPTHIHRFRCVHQLKELVADPTIAAEFEQLDKLAYKQCVRAWCADVLSTRLSKQKVNAMKPPAGYEELGLDIKHAIIQFGDYLEEIGEDCCCVRLISAALSLTC